MIIITGQTATGKTKLALELAKKHNGELINFDSRQIYKYLDIITGKDLPPRWSSRALRCHCDPDSVGRSNLSVNSVEGSVWLYDIVSPDQYFSSFDFVKQVMPIIKDVKKRNKTPILVGGTYLYLKHLLYGIDDNNSPPNFKLRDELNNKTVEELQNILKKLDVQSINRLNNSDRNNPRRLIRKIEIIKSNPKGTGFKRSDPLRYVPDQFIGIKYKKKEDLVKAIKIRVDKRLKQGAVEEVQSLLKKGYKETDPGMKTIGYQEIIQYLKGKITKKQAIEQWINHEIQYAKRQYTFMKKDKSIIWKEI